MTIRHHGPSTPSPCSHCHGLGHVCENHPDRPWGGLCCAVGAEGGTACEHGACGCGAGELCPDCTTPALDRTRRYLRPVPRRTGRPGDTHLALYGWEERLDAWVSWTTSLCGRSTEQGDLPMDATVTCEGCLGRRAQTLAVLDAETNPVAPDADLVAARRDPRYPVVHQQVRAFGWPSGDPMVPGSWADTLTTRVMAALRAQEAL